MVFLRVTAMLFVALTGAGTVLTRDPRRQVVAVSLHGLMLALVFFLYQAPDVSLSQVVIGAVALPLMILLALAKLRQERRRRFA